MRSEISSVVEEGVSEWVGVCFQRVEGMKRGGL